MSEWVALGARLGNCLRDASDDRRDDEDAKQVVNSHEDALQFQDWMIHLTYCQKQHRRPVDAEEVMVGETRPRAGSVDPVVAAESDPSAQLVVDAGIPVDRQHHDYAEASDSQRVGVFGAWLGSPEELSEPTEAQEPVEADVGRSRAEPRI